MSRKDTYRNYAIWLVLILFYVSFHFISNYGWIKKMDTSPVYTEDINLNGTTTITVSSKVSSIPQNEISNVQVPEKKKIDSAKKPVYTHKAPIQSNKSIPINQAEEEEWESLYNIGPFRAGRILSFRDALGGFYSVDQVGETYGLPDSIFRDIKSQLTVDSSFRKISINKIPYDSLYPHPYITKFMAYQIVRYREKEEQIHSANQLYDLLPEKDHERLKKLEPYLNYSIE